MNIEKNKGFTLVEMLIVLVILAILAAIAVPVTLSIIRSSDEVEIANDAKSIWNAAQTMLNDQFAKDAHFVSGSGTKYGLPLLETEMNITASNYNGQYGILFSGKYFVDITPENLNKAKATTKFTQNILSKIDNIDNLQMVYFASQYFYYCFVESEDDLSKAYEINYVVFKYYDKDTVYYYDGKKVYDTWPFTVPAKAKDLEKDKNNIKIGNRFLEFYCIKKYDNNKKSAINTNSLDYFKNATKNLP